MQATSSILNTVAVAAASLRKSKAPVLNDAATAALAEAANTIQHHVRNKMVRKQLETAPNRRKESRKPRFRSHPGARSPVLPQCAMPCTPLAHHVIRLASPAVFNRDRRSVWWLPRKPTRLYILDVIALAQTVQYPKPRFVLVPSGHWRPLWGFFLLAAATADLVACFWSLAYCHHPSYEAVNHVARGFLVVDVMLKFVSAYPTTRGTLELRPWAIAINYLRTGFLLDLLALLPLEVWLDRDPPRHMISWQLLHVPRWFLRWLYWDDFRSITTTSNNGAMQIFKYLLMLLMVTHISGCLFYYAAALPRICVEGDRVGLSHANSQDAINQHNEIGHRPWSIIPLSDSASHNSYQLYVLYSFMGFQALLADASFAFNSDTWLLSIGIMIVGNVLFAVVFGEVLLAISSLKRSSDAYAERMQSINESMNHDKIPENIQRRIRRFFEFSWLAVHGDPTDAQDYLNDLPNGLRIAVSLSLFGSLLKQVCTPCTRALDIIPTMT